MYCIAQTVVIDARGHMLGRLASIVAKQALNGQHIVSPSSYSEFLIHACVVQSVICML